MFKITSTFKHEAEIQLLKEKISILEKQNLELQSDVVFEREQKEKFNETANQQALFIEKLSFIIFKEWSFEVTVD